MVESEATQTVSATEAGTSRVNEFAAPLFILGIGILFAMFATLVLSQLPYMEKTVGVIAGGVMSIASFVGAIATKYLFSK
ncbi:MAG: hypothetical protein AAB897_00385 [Patescibacteria group bacterium]